MTPQEKSAEFEKEFREYIEASIRHHDVTGKPLSAEDEIEWVTGKVEELLVSEQQRDAVTPEEQKKHASLGSVWTDTSTNPPTLFIKTIDGWIETRNAITGLPIATEQKHLEPTKNEYSTIFSNWGETEGENSALPPANGQHGKHITLTTGMGAVHMDNYQNNESDMINISIVEDEDGECTIRASELLKMVQVFL